MTRCSHCCSKKALPYVARCRKCHNAYQRYYYHLTHRSPPVLTERYRQAYMAMGDPAQQIYVALSHSWCSYHQASHLSTAFPHNRTTSTGCDFYCREGRREWLSRRKGVAIAPMTHTVGQEGDPSRAERSSIRSRRRQRRRVTYAE
jgi:hypothetical protein